MSTYSPDLRIELITTGDQSGVWGTTTNSNLGTIIEDAISGYVTVSVTSAAQAFTALNGLADEARNAMIRLTTTTTAPFAVYAPPNSKQYIIWNNSGYAATIYNSTVIGNTTAAGTGVTIANGDKVVVFTNGTNFYIVKAENVTGTVAVDHGGTGQTSYTDGQLLIGNTTGNTLAKGTLTAGAGISVTNGAGSITIANSGVTSVSGTAPIASSGGATPTISITQAGASTNGYLSSTDWTTFNNKGSGTVTGVSVASANGFAGTSSGGATPALTLSTSINGLLYGNGTALAAATVSGPLSYSAGTLSIPQATGSVSGYLSSTDWNTFNNKQAAGSYLTTVSVSAPLGGSGTSGSPLAITGVLGTANGGTNLSSFNTYGIMYATSTSALATASFTALRSTGSDQQLTLGVGAGVSGDNFMRVDNSNATGRSSIWISNGSSNGTGGAGGSITLAANNYQASGNIAGMAGLYNTSGGNTGSGTYIWDNSYDPKIIFSVSTTSSLTAGEVFRVNSSKQFLFGGNINTFGASFVVNGNGATGRIFSVDSTSSGDAGNANLTLSKIDNVTTTSAIYAQFVRDSSGGSGGPYGSGQINANGANQAAFGTYSDSRLKENIVDLAPQLSNIMALRPVEFDYIESEGGGHQISFIAQEFNEVYPDAVGTRSDGMLTLTGWSKTDARIVKAMQEQQAIIEQLLARIVALEAR